MVEMVNIKLMHIIEISLWILVAGTQNNDMFVV